MKMCIRLAIAAAVGVASMALSGPAFAAFTPKLVVTQSARPGAASTLSLDGALAAPDDPAAKVPISAPVGYRAAPPATLSSQIGTVQAQAVAADLAGATLPLNGTVAVADPNGSVTLAGATTPIAAIAQACTQTTAHTQVWVLTLAAGGQQLQAPVFVDAASGPEAAIGSFKLQLCLPPPDVPLGTAGRADFGAKLFHAKLTLTNVFTTPLAPKLYVWRAFVTPYTPGAGTPNAAGTVEVRAEAFVPITLKLTGRYDPKTKSAVLAGSFSVAGHPLPGVALPLFAGPTASLKTLRRSASTTKTTAAGAFTATRRILRTTYFLVVAGTGGDVTQSGCAQQLPALPIAAPCTSATLANEATASTLVKVVVPPAKK